jgi:hypothetical protein
MDVTKGKRTPVDVVSYSHGRQTLPWVQSLNITPNGSAESYGQFGSDDAVLVVGSFTDADVAMEVLVSDQKQLAAALMDVNPAGEIVTLDVAQSKPVTILATYKGVADGTKIVGSVFVPSAVLSGAPVTEDLTTPAKVAFAFKGKLMRLPIGAKILYTRARGSAFAGFQTTEDKVFAGVGPYTVTLDQSAETWEAAGGASTLNYLAVFKDGSMVDTGFTVVTTTFTVTEDPSTTHVWEVFTLYTP